MADGYAKAIGTLGVVLTSTGAGAGNTAGSLIEAQTNGTPLIDVPSICMIAIFVISAKAGENVTEHKS